MLPGPWFKNQLFLFTVAEFKSEDIAQDLGRLLKLEEGATAATRRKSQLSFLVQ